MAKLSPNRLGEILLELTDIVHTMIKIYPTHQPDQDRALLEDYMKELRETLEEE